MNCRCEVIQDQYLPCRWRALTNLLPRLILTLNHQRTDYQYRQRRTAPPERPKPDCIDTEPPLPLEVDDNDDPAFTKISPLETPPAEPAEEVLDTPYKSPLTIRTDPLEPPAEAPEDNTTSPVESPVLDEEDEIVTLPLGPEDPDPLTTDTAPPGPDEE